MIEVKPIEGKYPWGVFEAGKIIGRFEAREMAASIMAAMNRHFCDSGEEKK